MLQVPRFSARPGLDPSSRPPVLDERLAERIRTLGHAAPGSMHEFVDKATLRENPGQLGAAEKMIASLVDDHESIVRMLRKSIETCLHRHHDAGSGDFLTGLLKKHEKTAWMLRSLLEG